jgi:diguanylate cyclase (GGDEF)-like protein
MRPAAKPAPSIDESLEPIAELALRGAGLRLRFPDPLEARYRQDTAAIRSSDMRSFALYTLALYFSVFLLATVAVHGLNDPLHSLLHGFTVVAVTLLVLPQLRAKVTFWQRKTAFFLLCSAFSLTPILFVATEARTPPIPEFILSALPISFLLLFSRLSYALAVLLAALTVASYSAMILLLPPLPAPNVGAYLISLVVLQSVPTLIALHSLERGARRLYLRSLLERLAYERASASNAVLTMLSYTDPLTGIANRRRMEVELARLCEQEDVRASFLMLDIDWFKGFNDHYGHPVGDRCLQEVANCLATALRDGDLLGRMGGEEFGVLLPGIVMQEGVLVAERLRAAVASFPFIVGTQIVKITVSIGISSIVPHDDPDRVVEAADKALYRAKQAGRNQVGGPWMKQSQ